MGERLKRWGEMAGAGMAVWALAVALVALVGGHLPPWIPWAEAMSLEDATKQNTQQIGQLNVLMLSDKVAQIKSAADKNPGDVNLQMSLSYWQIQLQQAMAASLPKPRH